MLLTALLALGTSSVMAQTVRSGGGSGAASAQFMQQMQQLASERTELQADNAKLKEQVAALQKQLKAAQTEKDSLGRKAQVSESAISRFTQSNETLNQTVTQQRTKMDELIAKFRETANTLREVESDRNTVKGQIGARERELKSCMDKNQALYKINLEVLDRMENQGFWTAVAKSEPFTRIKRTQIENLADDYRGKAEESRIPEPAKDVAPMSTQIPTPRS